MIDVITETRYNQRNYDPFMTLYPSAPFEPTLLLRVEGRFCRRVPEGAHIVITCITEYIARRDHIIRREQEKARKGTEKCDGDHGGAECNDPECWLRELNSKASRERA